VVYCCKKAIFNEIPKKKFGGERSGLRSGHGMKRFVEIIRSPKKPRNKDIVSLAIWAGRGFLLKYTMAFFQVKQCDKVAKYVPIPVPSICGSKEKKPNNVHSIWEKDIFIRAYANAFSCLISCFTPNTSLDIVKICFSVITYAKMMFLRALSDVVY